jgi:hypothetical protein
VQSRGNEVCHLCTATVVASLNDRRATWAANSDSGSRIVIMDMMMVLREEGLGGFVIFKSSGEQKEKKFEGPPKPNFEGDSQVQVLRLRRVSGRRRLP